MLQSIWSLYSDGLIVFYAFTLIAVALFILWHHVKNRVIATILIWLSGLTALFSLPVLLPLFILWYINNDRYAKWWIKKQDTAYTIGRVEGAMNALKGKNEISTINTTGLPFESWRSNLLMAADMGEDSLDLLNPDGTTRTGESKPILWLGGSLLAIAFAGLLIFCFRNGPF